MENLFNIVSGFYPNAIFALLLFLLATLLFLVLVQHSIIQKQSKEIKTKVAVIKEYSLTNDSLYKKSNTLISQLKIVSDKLDDVYSDYKKTVEHKNTIELYLYSICNRLYSKVGDAIYTSFSYTNTGIYTRVKKNGSHIRMLSDIGFKDTNGKFISLQTLKNDLNKSKY